MIPPIIRDIAKQAVMAAAEKPFQSSGCAVSGLAYAIIGKFLSPQSNLKQSAVITFSAAVLAGGQFLVTRDRASALAFGVITLTTGIIAQAILFVGSKLTPESSTSTSELQEALKKARSEQADALELAGGFEQLSRNWIANAMKLLGTTRDDYDAALSDEDLAKKLQQDLATSIETRVSGARRTTEDPALQEQLAKMQSQQKLLDELDAKLAEIRAGHPNLFESTESEALPNGRMPRLALLLERAAQQTKDLEAQVEKLTTENGELTTQIEQLQAALKEAQEASAGSEEETEETAEISELKTKLEAATAELEAKEKEKADLQEQVGKVQAAFEELKTTSQETEAKLKEQIEALGQELEAVKAAAFDAEALTTELAGVNEKWYQPNSRSANDLKKLMEIVARLFHKA